MSIANSPLECRLVLGRVIKKVQILCISMSYTKMFAMIVNSKHEYILELCYA